jgi:hypothetical protein
MGILFLPYSLNLSGQLLYQREGSESALFIRRLSLFFFAALLLLTVPTGTLSFIISK